MIVNIKSGYVYIRIPRTATGAVSASLYHHPGAISIKPYHGLDIPEKYKGFEVFTTIRHPYERCWDWWQWYNFKLSQNISFKNFMSKCIYWRDHGHETFPSTWCFITQADYIERANIKHVVKMDEIPKAINRLPFIRHIIDVLPSAHMVQDPIPISLMTADDIDIVNIYCPNDFELFN